MGTGDWALVNCGMNPGVETLQCNVSTRILISCTIVFIHEISNAGDWVFPSSPSSPSSPLPFTNYLQV
ncbi:hypothetical protein H1Q63_23505 [Desmonostoc muscorum CCALA 125]|nr:hypothetical protein [Desmonostoc muscorum CCALA 125]